MHRTGRNDPCPCGSGRKYKRCCLVATADHVLVTDADREMAYAFLDNGTAHARYADSIVAVMPLLDDPDVPLDDSDDLMHARVSDWLTLDVVLPDAGGTIAADLLRRQPTALSPGARQFIRELMGAPLRLLRVESDAEAADIVWMDVMSGATLQMADDADALERGDVVVARVVERFGQRWAEDVPALLFVDDLSLLVDELRRVCELTRGEGVPPEVERMVVSAALLRMVAAFEWPDELDTIEGDPVVPTRSRWHTSDAAVLRQRLDAAEDFTAYEIDETVPEEEGDKPLAEWTWSGPAGDEHRIVALAHLHVSETDLDVATATPARAARVRERLEALAGDLLTHLETTSAARPASGEEE